MRDFLDLMALVIIPQEPEAFWAFISAAANFILVYVAWKGLKSLGLTKRDMLTRAQRDARASAIARCEEFANVLLPLNHPNLEMMAKQKVPVFVKNEADVRLDPDNREHLDKAIEWWNAAPFELRQGMVNLLNKTEAWAMYFTKQLADPDVAYGPCAPAFCSMVLQFYPVLLVHRNASNASGKYPNLVALYKEWIAGLQAEKRGMKAGDLLKEAEKLQREGVVPPRTLPPPLGLED